MSGGGEYYALVIVLPCYGALEIVGVIIIIIKYDVNFKLKLDYQSVLEVWYDTRGNRYKLVPSYVNMNLEENNSL